MGSHRLQSRSSAGAFHSDDAAPRKDLWIPLIVGGAAAIYAASWSSAWQIQLSLWIILLIGLAAWFLGVRGGGGSFRNPLDAPKSVQRELLYLLAGVVAAVELLAVLWLLGGGLLVPITAFFVFFIGLIVFQYRYGEAIGRLRTPRDVSALPKGQMRLGLPESTPQETLELPESALSSRQVESAARS